MRRSIFGLLSLFCFFALPIVVNAEWYVNNVFLTNLNTNKNTNENNTEIVVSINIDVSYSLKGISAKLNFDSTKLEYIKCVSNDFTCSVNENIILDSVKGIEGKKEVAKLYFKKLNNFKKGENTEIKLTNIEGDHNVVSKNTKTVIHVLQDSIDLNELNIDNEILVPSFDKNITTYKVTTNKDKINMNGSALSIIEGLGEKSLEYGNNLFTIKVLSEVGTEKTYLINVFRKKEEIKINDNVDNNNNNKATTKETKKIISNNKNIKYLKIKNIDFNFNKNVYEYNIKIKNSIKEIIFDYELEDKKSKVVINGNTIIDKGNNVIIVSVIAEDGSELNYKFNIKNSTNDLVNVKDNKISKDNSTVKEKNKNSITKIIIISTISVCAISSFVLYFKFKK